MLSLRKSAAALATGAVLAAAPVMGASSAHASTPKMTCIPVSNVVTYDPMWQGQQPDPPTSNWPAWCQANELHGSVRNVQARLGGVAVDGVFGPATRARVVAFQRAHGLTPDGVVGDRTLSALGLMYLDG